MTERVRENNAVRMPRRKAIKRQNGNNPFPRQSNCGQQTGKKLIGCARRGCSNADAIQSSKVAMIPETRIGFSSEQAGEAGPEAALHNAFLRLFATASPEYADRNRVGIRSTISDVNLVLLARHSRAAADWFVDA
jgi:hypothetical protein